MSDTYVCLFTPRCAAAITADLDAAKISEVYNKCLKGFHVGKADQTDLRPQEACLRPSAFVADQKACCSSPDF